MKSSPRLVENIGSRKCYNSLPFFCKTNVIQRVSKITIKCQNLFLFESALLQICP